MSSAINKILFFIALIFCSKFISAQNNFKPYHLQKAIQSHDSYGWDYLAASDDKRHLFVSHGIKLIVIDMDKDTIIDEIQNTIGIHGIALNCNLSKGFTSNGKTNSLTVFNLNNFHVFDTIAINGKNPDAILFDKFSNQIFTFNGRSKDATAIDPLSMKENGTISLGGKPEFAVCDDKGSIFVNLEDKNEIVQIDSKERAVINQWSIAPGNEPTGLAIDTANKLLFSVCDNNLLIVSNYRDKKIVSTLHIGGGADAVVFDPITKIIYSSNGEGNVSIFQQQSPAEYKLLQTLITQKGCRTMMIDKRSKKIYLPAGKFQEGKKHLLPNTFEVLVYSNQ